MTTKIAKRKQKPEQNGCPVGEKKKKTNGAEPEDKHGTESPSGSVAIKTKKSKEDRMVTSNGRNGPQEPALEGFKYVESFRQKLHAGAVAMDAIRHFIQQSYRTPRYIVDYIRAGGTFKQLMDILDACEKDKHGDIADVFHLIHFLLIQSIDYDETHASYASKCANTIMTDYKPVIVRLLRDRGEQAQSCKASALRILKAILLVDSRSYGRDVLKLIDVCMPDLEMHKCREVVSKQGGMVQESLRTVFIEFNIAFLIDTTPELVRLWLSRTALIYSLTQNLVFDTAENVILVMRSFRQYVLDCDAIDKYIYRTVFVSDTLKALVNVYEWVGPEKQAPDEEKKKSILNATEAVVLPLLTSKRYFLVPKSIDLNRASPRHKHLLLGLKNSQLHDHQKRLVLRLFETCPEVLPAVLENYGGLLKTKNVSHRKLLLDILRLHKPTELVAKLEPGVVTAKALSNFVIKSTLPRTALEYIGVAMGARKENIPFCLEALSVMITQCEQYLVAIGQAQTVDQFGIKKLKFDVINQILALFPTIDRIMMAMEQHRDDREAKHTNVAMEHAMDILLVCIRSFPAYIESSSFITTYRDILKPGYRTASLEMHYLNYEFKAIKVVIALEPQSVSFGSPLFPSVLQLVSKIYLNSGPTMRHEATEMLLALFRNTTLFGNRGTEIEFWFQALFDVAPSMVPELVLYLANAARKAAAKISEKSASGADHTLINEAFETVGDRKDGFQELFVRVEQEQEAEMGAGEGNSTTADVQMELPVTDNFFIYMFAKWSTHPPKYERYFEGVMLRYLHYLPHPEIVQKALLVSKGESEERSSALSNYVRSWMSGKECALGREDGWGVLCRLSEALIAKDKTAKPFPADVTQWQNFRSELRLMLHQTIFHLSRLIVAGTLTADQMDVISFYTNQLLDLLLQEGSAFSEAEVGEVIAGLFLQRPVLFEHFTIIVRQHGPGDVIGHLVAEFVHELMRKLHHLPDFLRYTALYSNKIVSQLIHASTKELDVPGKMATGLDSKLVEKLLCIFKLNKHHCVTLLRHYAQLPVEAFCVPEKNNQRTFHYTQLCFALEQLTTGSCAKEHSLIEPTLPGLVRIYMECGRSVGNDAIELDDFERALFGYLSTFTHSIAFVDAQLMRVFFENRQRIGKPLVKLATFLLGRDSRFDAPFLELVGQHTTKKELVYPLLNVAFRRSVLSAATMSDSEDGKRLLTKLYGEFKTGIQKMLEKPHKAAVIYRENTLANVSLVRLCMPRNECVDFARKKLRIEAVEVFQLRVLKEIYGNALEALKEDSALQTVVYGNVFSVLFQCFEVLFRSIPSAEDFLQREAQVACLNELVLTLYGWSKQVKSYKALQEMTFESVTASANWNTFCKTCLKLGIDTPRSALNPRRYDERLHVLPKIMAVLVNLFYVNDKPEQSDIGRYYDWVLSHSLFLRVLLTQFNYKPKTALVHLLYVLMTKNATVANSQHVPLLLGAYGATLTDCNRYILALLQLYEQAEVEMHVFRPFLWGETAIKHFSLESDGDLSQQQRNTFRTNPSDVFSLLAKEKISATVQQFPVWRRLDASAQLPETDFDDLTTQPDAADEHQWSYQPTSPLEQFVEKSNRQSPPPAELIEMRADKVEQRALMYDPAFLMPMLSYLFSPENADMLDVAGRVGALSLPFVCLASNDEKMRLAAGDVIQRVRGHLEQTRKFIDSKFWLHLFSAVQNGFSAMKDRRGQADVLPKAPFLSTIFIAETINVLPDVLSDLHGPMTRYVMQKEVYDFRAIPNFMSLFHSADVKNSVHRMFMLETIYRGVQTHEDFGLLRASPIIRVLMHFYASSLSNRELNITILNSLNAIAKIPKSCEVLVNSCGFLAWLSLRIDAIESFHFDTIEAFLGILSNCWYSMQLMSLAPHGKGLPQRQQGRVPLSFQRTVLITTLKFLPLLSTRSSSKTLIRFLNLLEKTTTSRFSNERLLALVSEQVLQQMMEYFEKLFGAHLWCVRYVRQCGTHGCDDDVTTGNKLRDGGVDQTTISIVTSLRRIVVHWHNFHTGAVSCAATDAEGQKMEVEDVDENSKSEIDPDEQEFV